jgi:hypothetical protein
LGKETWDNEFDVFRVSSHVDESENFGTGFDGIFYGFFR